MLTHGELQLAVDRVNSGLHADLGRLEAVQAVNWSLGRAGRGLLEALGAQGLGLEGRLDTVDEER